MALPGTEGDVERGMTLTDAVNDLRQKLTHAEAVIAELRDVVAGRKGGCGPSGDEAFDLAG